MTLPTDAIHGAITTCNKGGGDRFTMPAQIQLQALLDRIAELEHRSGVFADVLFDLIRKETTND